MTNKFTLRNPNFESDIRTNFTKQGLMAHLGASLHHIEPGYVAISLPYTNQVGQQHGLFHAGTSASIADSACGYAALSLMPPLSDVLSIEFKINLLAPALGHTLIAHARVIRPGRTITVCQADLIVHHNDNETLCALMQATMIQRQRLPDE
ncbi:MAG TPA: PaaI family thioesterase [Anaerolineae bacterium]|nr:PaaI family thioesterase [Anaerolineae bacterium]